ncbi:NAD(P)-binding protein [Neptuniibacter pectenicola]|uniref:NAD(P)-binding protein n=1 Tax=Neptuniibacter pectenicola TaxID=1806669 RepID=A0ABU9TS54_9GAMM
MSLITTDIAIIGAGTSGCCIAGELRDTGFDCVLIEKSRGLGGRCSRRYIDANSVDLGAPEFLFNSVENTRLKSLIKSWIHMGYLDPWVYQKSSFNEIGQQETIESLSAVPSMNAWHKKIAGDINTYKNIEINSLVKSDDFWHLMDYSGKQVISAKYLIITCPAEQSLALLRQHNIFSDNRLTDHKSLPQFVCAIGFTQALNIKSDVYRGGHSFLSTAIREHSKPKRVLPSPLQEVWMLHSTHDWAEKNVSENHQQAAQVLTSQFIEHFDIQSEPQILSSHYWRLSRHQINEPVQTPFIWNKEMRIGCCGDWLSSGDITGALTSAVSLYEEITSDYK